MHTLESSHLKAVVLIGLLLTGGAITWFVAAGASRSDGGYYPIGTPASSSQSSPGEPTIGSMAPDFRLTDVNTGQRVSMAALRGRPVWINFWATWCPPCKAELPRIKQEYDKYKG